MNETQRNRIIKAQERGNDSAVLEEVDSLIAEVRGLREQVQIARIALDSIHLWALRFHRESIRVGRGEGNCPRRPGADQRDDVPGTRPLGDVYHAPLRRRGERPAVASQPGQGGGRGLPAEINSRALKACGKPRNRPGESLVEPSEYFILRP